jgi:hypothetical protein
VVAKVTESLAVSKQATLKCDGERLNLRKLNELEFRKQYRIEITNRFAAMENLSDGEDINMAWENIKENVKTSAKQSIGLYELQQHKPWFDEKCLGFLYQRKQAKMQWVQVLSQSNVNNQNIVKREASGHFRLKKKEYLKVKIEVLESNSQIKNIRDLYRGIIDLKKGYHPDLI